MPSTPFLIIVFVSGYFFISNNFTKKSIQIHKLKNLTQYLEIALWSIGLLIASALFFLLLFYLHIVQFLSAQIPDVLNMSRDILGDFKNPAYSYYLFWILLIDFFAGVIPHRFIVRVFHNILFCRRDQDLKEKTLMDAREKLEDVSPFDTLMIDSQLFALPILFMLDDNKVYVGWVETSDRDFRVEWDVIELYPVMSGYRDPVTKEVDFTTFYPMDAYSDENERELFRKIIKYEHIESANLFDIEVYVNEFEKQKTGTSKKKHK